MLIIVLVATVAFLYNQEILQNVWKKPNVVDEPPSHEELVNFSLSLINADRQSFGLQNVTLSSITSGQLHAQDMLDNNYFSHWNRQSYKPYVRYTLAGGKGAVAENIATQWGNISNFTQALKDLQWQMMYNDSSSDWGHKENILNPFHNKVSIGIAYDNYSIFLVQDFEDDYVEWSNIAISGSKIELKGAINKPGLTVDQIGICFDTVSNLTSQQLSNPPYQDAYDSGIYIGAVVPPEWVTWEGITINAQTWNQTGQNIELNFDLKPAFDQKGEGIYTLYLWTKSEEHLTTYSILHI